MQIRHTIVLAITALFMAVSCITVDKTMGEGLIPSDQNIPVRFAEIDIPVQLKSSQPMQQISATESVFGSIRTPEFGLVEFATAADVFPNTTGWDFGKDPVVKEVYFIAAISSKIVMEDEQEFIPQIITIHKTKKNVDSTTVFQNSFTEADYDPQPLNLSEYTYFGGDSIRIYLDNSYAEEILKSTQEEKDSLDLFAQRYKGLLIKSNTPEDGTYGGRENVFTFGGGSIFILVDYQPTWEEGLSRKDTIFTLSCGRDFCLNLSSYESDAMQTSEPLEILPVEGVAGVKPYISKDQLKDAIDAWRISEGYEDKKIAIAKGALIFPFEIPQDNDMTKYPQSLYPCYRDMDTTFNVECFYSFEDINVTGYSIGAINRSLCEYKVDIPTVIQDFVNKSKSELDNTYNMWMMPVYSETDETYGTTYFYIDNATYYVGNINGPKYSKVHEGESKPRRPKLQMVYTVIDK